MSQKTVSETAKPTYLELHSGHPSEAPPGSRPKSQGLPETISFEANKGLDEDSATIPFARRMTSVLSGPSPSFISGTVLDPGYQSLTD